MSGKQKKESTIRKHDKIRTAYQQLVSIKEAGVRKYSDEYILRKLHLRFFLSEKYIDAIICNRA